jgi:hypothetical protein
MRYGLNKQDGGTQKSDDASYLALPLDIEKTPCLTGIIC